jgi:hypothetical protein
MPRASRHYLPGHIWDLTHRCYRKQFLLKFLKDRRIWTDWLYTVCKRHDAVRGRAVQAVPAEDQVAPAGNAALAFISLTTSQPEHAAGPIPARRSASRGASGDTSPLLGQTLSYATDFLDARRSTP